MHLNKLESVDCPRLITTNAPDGKLNDICNFFQSEFKFSSKNLKYDNNISELIKSIDTVECFETEAPVPQKGKIQEYAFQ